MVQTCVVLFLGQEKSLHKVPELVITVLRQSLDGWGLSRVSHILNEGVEENLRLTSVMMSPFPQVQPVQCTGIIARIHVSAQHDGP